MEQFVYHNLFETKGIEYIITIIFFALLVPFWLTLNKKKTLKEQTQTAIGVITSSMLKIPQGLFYYPNHLWAHMEKSGLVKVGIDDFFQHIAGEVQINNFIDPESKIKKGQILFKIIQNEKSLTLTAPISGTITRVNTELLKNYRIINSDPYNTGWVFEIKPDNWKNEIITGYFSEDATNWMDTELKRFKDFLSASISKYMPEKKEAIYQDNDEVADNILTSMPVEIWKDFQKEFLD